MFNTLVLRTVIRSIGQRIPSIGSALRPLTFLFVPLLVLPMAWTQAAPPFNPQTGQELTGRVDINTAPGVTIFENQIFTVWCGSNEYVQTSFQTSVSSQPYASYTSTIPCAGGNGTGRISVAVFNAKLYAMCQCFNFQSYDEFTIISSSDGINWTSSLANVTYDGFQDGTFDLGFGLYAFQPSGSSQPYLYLAYSSTFNPAEGYSVARSPDGQNFTWQSVVAPPYNSYEAETWAQSPAIYAWTPNEGGTGDLYVSYITTNGYVVMAHSADGLNWSSQEITSTVLNRDAMLVSHNGALYVGGQSIPAQNLLMGGSYDGITWPTPTNYGSIMRTSLSAVDYDGSFYNVIVGNFNDDLWGQWAPVTQ